MTKWLARVERREIGLLSEAGAIAFANGKASLANAKFMRKVLAYAKYFDALIVHLLEDADLAKDGVMNEGEVATRLGLRGVPAAAETIMLERDIRLVELSGGRYHAGQISCRASLDIVRAAKARGLPVTCGVSINHLTLNENDIGPYRTFFKMKPPLRSEDDRRAMVEGIARRCRWAVRPLSGCKPRTAQTADRYRTLSSRRSGRRGRQMDRILLSRHLGSSSSTWRRVQPQDS